MRVYISVDMEGVAGVVHEDQTDPIDPRHAAEYNRLRRLMTAEANAAIEGALAAGADTRAGERQPLAHDEPAGRGAAPGGRAAERRAQGASDGRGRRGRASTRRCSWAITRGPASVTPIIDHTYTAGCTRPGSTAGRSGSSRINAALAGTYGVPVALVSGDQALAAEARDLLGAGGGDRDREARRRPVCGPQRGAVGGVPPDPRGHDRGARPAARAVPAPCPGPARGGVRSHPDGRHGRAGAGVGAHLRSNGGVSPTTTTGRCSAPGARSTTWPASLSGP